MDGQVVSQGILIVSAIRDDGLREVLAAEDDEAPAVEMTCPPSRIIADSNDNRVRVLGS